mmetsp:Transcript_81704/g.170988  ORF Transcript_81704/g.170988 Transcript_81704/m.170988 type:complete len:224 (-) Transcript_81704:1008-1679(-)
MRRLTRNFSLSNNDLDNTRATVGRARKTRSKDLKNKQNNRPSSRERTAPSRHRGREAKPAQSKTPLERKSQRRRKPNGPNSALFGTEPALSKAWAERIRRRRRVAGGPDPVGQRPRGLAAVAGASLAEGVPSRKRVPLEIERTGGSRGIQTGRPSDVQLARRTTSYPPPPTQVVHPGSSTPKRMGAPVGGTECQAARREAMPFERRKLPKLWQQYRSSRPASR